MSKQVEVRFVATPFLPEHQPALGVSSLVAVLAQRGVSADVRYLNLEYGRAIGWEMYGMISRGLPADLLAGEVIFAGAMWGDAMPSFEGYEELLAERYSRSMRAGQPNREEDVAGLIHEIRRLRACAPDWIARWADDVLEGSPRVIGLTTTFAQTNASLALARELRRRRTKGEVKILLGGANCEGAMGRCLSDNFDFIDHVVSGEAENVICDLVRDDRATTRVNHPRYVLGKPVAEMDTLPIPDFADYFEAVRGTDWERDANLSAESSRGCWWGQKSHCTFCGLNGETMAFRSKSPDRFAIEIELLCERYGRNFFSMTDNILDMKYVQTLFPMLARRGSKLKFFYETKSNLRKDQLEMLVAGGVARLQPGIESLSTPILKLMAKGTSRLQNIQLIKWCMEYRVDIAWLFLFGFPGESPAEYAEMERIIPSLRHLQAPIDAGQIRLDRFSPYFRNPGGVGMDNVRPAFSYGFAFPGMSSGDLDRMAYYFDFSYRDEIDPRTYVARCLELLAAWRAAWETAERPALEFSGPDKLIVLDTRGSGERRITSITAAERQILVAIDRVRGVDRLRDEVDSVTPDELEQTLSVFRSRGWIAEDGDQVLSLVVDRTQRERIAARRIRMQREAGAAAIPVG